MMMNRSVLCEHKLSNGGQNGKRNSAMTVVAMEQITEQFTRQLVLEGPLPVKEREVKIQVNGDLFNLNDLKVSAMTKELMRENFTELASLQGAQQLALMSQVTSDCQMPE